MRYLAGAEGGPTVMTIFLVLNGLGVAFLLYVLVNFWKEAHRSENNAREHVMDFDQRDWADMAVMTHPISHSAQGGVSVIPFRTRDQHRGKTAHRVAS